MRCFLKGRCVWAVLGGLLLSTAFAPLEFAGAAWVAPGLILFCALGCRGGRAFRLGFVAGFALSLASLDWLLAMPFTWLGIPLAPGLAWIALSAYCGLFTGLWAWFCWRTFPGGTTAVDSPPLEALERFLSRPLSQRAVWMFLCAASWVALEMARARFLSGFPWNFIGTSQYRMLPVIQIASVTGVYGVSFLAVWFSVGLAGAAISLVRRPAQTEVWGQAGVPLVAVACVVAFGMTKLDGIPTPERTLKVALVQPSIPQNLIWDDNENAVRFQKVIALSEKALASKPDLLLWPESAVPNFTEENQDAIAQLLQRHPTWLILCGDAAELAPSGETNYFNASLLFNPSGHIKSIYHKRRLVIFGEYIPLLRWLPFLKFLTPIGSGYTPGVSPVQFNLTDPAVQTSVLICFEDMFPQEAREHVLADTDFLINLTNDGWFGEGAEQWQQAAGALFRAIENGVPLLRCANNGLTCWIDAQGRLRQYFHNGRNIYGAGFMTAEIPLREKGRGAATLYNLYGDWFGWACCILAGAMLVLSFLPRGGAGAVSVPDKTPS